MDKFRQWFVGAVAYLSVLAVCGRRRLLQDLQVFGRAQDDGERLPAATRPY